MSQTLIIHSQKPVVELLALNLPIYVGTDVISKDNFEACHVLIENHPGIHLIICADITGNEATAESVFKLNKSLKKSTPMIVLGEKATLPTDPKITVLHAEPNLKLILQASAKYLKVTPKKMVEAVVPDFFPILIHYCLEATKAPCDIYVLKGETDYEKKYSTGDMIDEVEIHELENSGAENIYVDAANRIKFVNHVTTSLASRLTDPSLTMEEKVNVSNKAMKVIQEEAIKGNSPMDMSVQDIANNAINLCFDIAKNNPTVAGLLKKLLSNKGSYLYKHVQLIIFVCDHIIKNMEWGSKEHLTKLGFVAFFHDICLTEDKLAKFTNDFAVRADETLSPSQRDTILTHAKTSADIARKFTHMPIGADIIIIQHHGAVGGQGFANTFTNSLSPLAIVFIVAEEFAHLILELGETTDVAAHKAEMIKKLHEKYSRSQYKKIIDIVNTITF